MAQTRHHQGAQQPGDPPDAATAPASRHTPAAGSPAQGTPMPVPAVLRDAAGWSWRILVVGALLVITARVLVSLYFVVLPATGALFATALMLPLLRWLRARGLPNALATWLTVLVVLVLLGGALFLVIDRAAAEYPDLVDQVSRSVDQARDWAVRHFDVQAGTFDNLQSTITGYLAAHRTAVASGALTGIATVSEGLAAFVLWFFMTFFFLYDGPRIWGWVVGLFPSRARGRVDQAGAQAWARLAGFVRGTFLIAVFHGVVVGVALAIMGVPLVLPLALLVFIGSFLPIVGAVVFGGLALVVALVTKGVFYGLAVFILLIVDNQIESHLLQPFLVGRYVRLHPLAVAVSIAAGSVLEGVYGAILAVPFVAVVYAVLHYLVTGRTDAEEDAAVVDATS